MSHIYGSKKSLLNIATQVLELHPPLKSNQSLLLKIEELYQMVLSRYGSSLNSSLVSLFQEWWTTISHMPNLLRKSMI